MWAKIKNLFQNDAFVGALLTLVVFIVYLTTVGPSTGFIDAGELAAMAYTFGIAHPTGYPLFTVLAGAFSHLPLGGTAIWKLNVFAALCCAASVFFFYHVFLRILVVKVQKPDSGLGTRRIAAAVAVLILAFSRTFWSQAVGVEVYSLHLLLVSLVLLLFLRALPGNAFVSGSVQDPAPRRARWFAFSLVLGLSFTNHMTTLLLLPALLYLYFVAHGWGRPAWKNAGRALPFFLLGLLPYLYLPLRAAAHPAMNWGAIVDTKSFYWHISGKQYSGWMFSSLEPAGRQFALFVNTLASEFGYLALVPALAGAILMFIRSRRLFVFVLLLYVGCLAYSINYDIADIVNYFLLAYLSIAIAAAFGIGALLENVGAGGRRGTFFAACGLAALCFLLPLGLHYHEVDESGNYATEDYARNLLNSTEANGVIFTTQWDHFIAAADYLQLVEGIRPDVVLVDRELLRRSWYYRYLSQRHPWLTEGAQTEINAFLPEVGKFERKEPYDPGVIQSTFENVVHAMMRTSLETRAVYVTHEIEAVYVGNLGRIPSGGLLRVYSGAAPAFVPNEMTFRPFPKDNEYFRTLGEYYAIDLTNQGLYLASRGDLGGGEHFLRRALEAKPDFRDAGMWLQRVEAEKARIASAPSTD